MHFGVIGAPIAHSQSPQLFAEFWAEHPWRDRLTYTKQHVAPDDLEDFLGSTSWAGFNVTLPHKQRILPFLHALTPTAEAMGAVNTVVRTAHGWMGHNTDADGFWGMLAGRSDLDALKARPVLVLGNGGSARAVVHALASRGFRGQLACRQAQGGFPWPEVRYSDLPAAPQGLVVQCTPLGMAPQVEDMPPLPAWGHGQVALAIDLVYQPSETLFMRHMAELGAETASGAAMLRHQAKKAWDYWAEVLNIPHI
ncbi:MAG: shikimate dehydrogenase family protein [Schleiferiaceae bacterium]